MAYNHRKIEEKYRQIWHDKKVYQPDLLAAKNPYYNLMMFPYPSAEGLHVGNMYAFTGADVHGRFRRMQGYDVFEPIGLDGFGIHSENYAIKVGRHPAEQAKISQERFYNQLDMIGNGFAWENRLETYDPDFYRWTQWLFNQMFKNGLAYKSEAAVNWCPSCKTVLADEQVEDGKCERCKTVVERRNMSSWFFRITTYADRLLENIDQYEWEDFRGQKHVGLDWPGKVTIAQKNWIGRQSGLEIDFIQENTDQKIPVWTKFWETIFGVTYLVVAPEFEHIQSLITQEQRAEVEKYIQTALNKSEQERKMGEKEKTGVFTGSYVINPVNGEKVPVWVADYVLAGVGTGAVMGVPAHDERDFDFAKKFNLPIRQVVSYEDEKINQAVSQGERAHEGEGILVHSGKFDGQSAWGEGKTAMQEWMKDQGFAREKVSYHLRDWLISRQRYWGPPIPLVHCSECAESGKGEREDLPGWYTVPDEELPVLLPNIQEYQPTGDGTSPLSNAPEEWRITKCPGCGGQAERELDVSDTFLDSAWYFLRYPAIQAKEHPFPHVPKWFPVDAYIGGAEHAVLHLLYARFFTMALKDWGYVPQEEPFPFLFGHGLIIKDGAKMSKSRGNVVNPDEYIDKYGADSLRSYLMFLGPYDQGGDFRDTGMNGMYKWLQKVAEMFSGIKDGKTSPALRQKLHQTIAANTADMEAFKYNTCLARLMEVVNLWKEGNTLSREDGIIFLKLLAPFAPYLTEELYQIWQEKNEYTSLHVASWPEYDPALLIGDTVNIVIQVNGKWRAEMEVSQEIAKNEDEIVGLARQNEQVQKFLMSEPKKTIFVPGKIVNFVI